MDLCIDAVICCVFVGFDLWKHSNVYFLGLNECFLTVVYWLCCWFACRLFFEWKW